MGLASPASVPVQVILGVGAFPAAEKLGRPCCDTLPRYDQAEADHFVSVCVITMSAVPSGTRLTAACIPGLLAGVWELSVYPFLVFSKIPDASHVFSHSAMGPVFSEGCHP